MKKVTKEIKANKRMERRLIKIRVLSVKRSLKIRGSIKKPRRRLK